MPEADDDDTLEVGMGGEERIYLAEGDGGRSGNGITVNAGADEWEGYGAETVVGGEAETFAVA